MDTALHAARLFRRTRARLTPERPVQPDFADFGTAFGLDMSMAPPLADPVPLAPDRDSGFWRRFAQRRAGQR